MSSFASSGSFILTILISPATIPHESSPIPLNLSCDARLYPTNWLPKALLNRTFDLPRTPVDRNNKPRKPHKKHARIQNTSCHHRQVAVRRKQSNRLAQWARVGRCLSIVSQRMKANPGA
jgi:hypothetical protein